MKIDVQGIKTRIYLDGLLTKWEFDRLLVRGWKERKRGYASGTYRSKVDAVKQNMDVEYDRLPYTNFCAVGVVGEELGVNPAAVYYSLPYGTRAKIVSTSDAAGKKTTAIRRIKAIQW